jgi:hypothetical protein
MNVSAPCGSVVASRREVSRLLGGLSAKPACARALFDPRVAVLDPWVGVPDPWVAMLDPWVGVLDPWVTESAPWVAELDPRVL